MATTLNDIFQLAERMKDADNAVREAEEKLKKAKEDFTYLQEEAIPTAMQEIGLEEVTLTTGEKLKINQEVYASIPNKSKPAAFKWLTDNNFGGLIKIDVTAKFGKNESEEAVELENKLAAEGLSVSIKQDVHAQTLKAWLKEQMAKGASIPLELFGARPVWQAKISNK